MLVLLPRILFLSFPFISLYLVPFSLFLYLACFVSFLSLFLPLSFDILLLKPESQIKETQNDL